MPSNLGGSTLLASEASTSSRTSSAAEMLDGRGLQVILDVTASPNNAETLTVKVQAYDRASDKYQTVTAFTALAGTDIGATATTATYVYTLYPGAAETAATGNHEVQALPPPRTFRVVGTQSAAGSWTYSVSYRELP